jgi:hypothetical protein
MRCEEVSHRLPGLVDSARPMPSDVAEHLGTCLRCQAESARYRRLARTMRQLRTQFVAPSPDLLLGILEWIDAADTGAPERSSRSRRAAYVAAAATAATAAGAAGALVIASRSRRGRLGLAG